MKYNCGGFTAPFPREQFIEVLVAPIAMHFLLDFVGIVLMPMIAGPGQ